MNVDRILLTNDDGAEAAGLTALYDALAEEYAVTVVAPADDQSSVGRVLSDEVAVADHDRGYVVDGTPVDCVVAGLGELVPDADLVVAGCNEGANLGAYTLGRSGTVSAAVEAAFFGVPAVATSMYVPGDEDWWRRELEPSEFANATRATRFLVDEAPAAGVFDRADYLNVNAPVAGGDANAGRRSRAAARHVAVDVVRDASRAERRRSRRVRRPDLGADDARRRAGPDRNRPPRRRGRGSVGLAAVRPARRRAGRRAR